MPSGTQLTEATWHKPEKLYTFNPMKQAFGNQMYGVIVLIIMLIGVNRAEAQFVTGKWYGSAAITQAAGYHVSSTEPAGDILEIFGVDSSKINGLSYQYYWFRGTFYYCIKSLECAFDAGANEWVVRETAVKDNHLFSAHYPCLHTYRLHYINHGNKDSLNGTWTAASVQDCGSGPGRFARTRPVYTQVRNAWDSIDAITHIVTLPKQESNMRKDLPQVISMDKLKKEAAFQQMMTRSRTLMKAISLQSPAIKVEIWDNGVIDGDNISVYFNKELVVNRKRITAQAIVLELMAVAGQENELIMYANNLGDIPPNTAMMRVYANNKQYEVEMSSDEHSNGIIRFTLER